MTDQGFEFDTGAFLLHGDAGDWLHAAGLGAQPANVRHGRDAGDEETAAAPASHRG